MRKLSVTLYLLLLISVTVNARTASLADYVDMYMGVRGNSNCVIGPQLPHGSVNPAPQTPNGGQNGYDENDLIRGFGQLHVSGIGWSRYGQIFLSPQIGFSAKENGHDSKKSNEVVSPFYYKVDLDRYGITTELAPTTHAVAYRFTYPDKKNKTLLLDMRHSIPQHIVPIVKGRFLGGNLQWNPETSELSGWGEYAGGFGSADPYKVYFSMTLDDPNAKVSISDKGDKELYARIDTDRPVLNANVGVSLKSVDRARNYRYIELDGKDVDKVAKNAKDEWNRALGRIQLGDDVKEKDKKLFYTALYHSLVMPRDRSGDNPNWSSAMPHIDDHYCVWDTWRTAYPLLTLLEESFVSKTINSFIDRLDHDGKVTPTFTASMEWDSKQGGDDVDNIIADAIIKNVKGFDREKAYKVMLHNARESRSPDYIAMGYEPGRNRQMSCSYTMEHAYNDNCLSRIAQLMGDTAMANEMAVRSRQWEKMFNPDLESCGFKGFIAPVTAEGERIEIDPAEVYGSWVDYFYEGNSWTYSLFTPADFERLIALCGGKEEMVKRLKYGFDNNLINLSNEPGFLAPFIFSHCDRPDLAGEYVNRIRNNYFSIEKGYPDNEDSGAMGSWYVFTSLGLFPNAGQDIYYLLPPAFSESSLTMENGKKIVVKAHKKTPGSNDIASVKLNGCDLSRSWIRHDEIADGAVIEFELSENPDEWGVREFEASKEKPGMFGVNLAGAEFFHKKMEGVGRFNVDYHYPTTEELDYWHSKGMDLIRLPFKWDRIQREVNGPLSKDEADYIKYLLREADARGMKILLDMHNYGRRNYGGEYRIIGDSLMPTHFGQAWAELARQFKDEPGLYGYGLCNEPHDMLESCPWVEIAQVAIDSIRSVDRRTAIVVAGNTWSSAERWPEINQGLESLNDPNDNLIFEAHCYFDRDASGIYREGYDAEGAYPTIGVDRVRPFVDWLKKHNKRGLLGEYGVPGDDPRWLECLDLFLNYLAENGVEGTYWAAGARWNKYILGVHPEENYTKDRPQMEILTKYTRTK
ncbi:MAG: GH92 family glycosyl hydrolase [Muribaculaceae bacterium]|nr:GH92 family glycosyl hydrolase [Muribaculaceae bacterium]